MALNILVPLSNTELEGLFVVAAGCVLGAGLGYWISFGIPKWYLSALELDPPADVTVWHPWYAYFPVRSVNGSWILIGEVWRRRTDDQWQYKPREMTSEEWEGNQW